MIVQKRTRLDQVLWCLNRVIIGWLFHGCNIDIGEGFPSHAAKIFSATILWTDFVVPMCTIEGKQAPTELKRIGQGARPRLLQGWIIAMNIQATLAVEGSSIGNKVVEIRSPMVTGLW